MFQHNTASFIASGATIGSASIVDSAVSPFTPALKLTGVFERRSMYEGIDLPLSGWLPKFFIRNKRQLDFLFLKYDGIIHRHGQVVK